MLQMTSKTHFRNLAVQAPLMRQMEAQQSTTTETYNAGKRLDKINAAKIFWFRADRFPQSRL